AAGRLRSRAVSTGTRGGPSGRMVMGPALPSADMVDEPGRFSRPSPGHVRRHLVGHTGRLCDARRDGRSRGDGTDLAAPRAVSPGVPAAGAIGARGALV